VKTRVLILLACTGAPLFAACGGASPAPATPGNADAPTSLGSTPPTPSAPSTAAPSDASPTSSGGSMAASLDAPYDDVETDPTTLSALFDKNNRPSSFPKATDSESTCWQTIGLSGDAQKDYDVLASKCGTPTGSLAYTKPALGKLHSIKDKRDTYNLHLLGGLCYRFFGVADGTVQDLDILIEQKNGALVGDDKTHGPVAIIESDKSWCMDRDVDYQFLVQVGGSGTGHYVFGVWAKPK
jgi:hypothetical protein